MEFIVVFALVAIPVAITIGSLDSVDTLDAYQDIRVFFGLKRVEIVEKGAYNALLDDYCGVRKELYRVIEEREELDRKLQALQRSK